MRKTWIVVLLIVLSLSLFACKGGEAKTYNVGVTLCDFEEAYMKAFRVELEEYFKSLETEKIIYNLQIVNADNEAITQQEQLETFISRGVDVLIVSIAEGDSMEELNELVRQSKIPCILINPEPITDSLEDNIYYVGSDAKQTGALRGEIISELANHADINENGEVGCILLKAGANNPDSVILSENTLKTLGDKGYTTNVFYEANTGNNIEDSFYAAAAGIAQFPDDAEVILCDSEEAMLGAHQAITAAGKEVGKDIYLVGANGMKESCEMVASGTLSGTVFNDFILQSHKAADTAIKLMNGETADKFFRTNPQKVTTPAEAGAIIFE